MLRMESIPQGVLTYQNKNLNKQFHSYDIHVQPLLYLQSPSLYFEQLIKESFLDNTHKAYVYLYPEEGKNERLEEELKAQLAKMKNKLNSKQLNYLIEDTKKLKEFQETPSLYF